MKYKKYKKHKKIYLISGKWKHSILPTPHKNYLRVTLGRVRIILFNWINNIINNNWKNLICLDLFAGSGSLGFEIASRGALYVVMIEKNKYNFKKLINFKKKLNIFNVNIINNDSFKLFNKSIFYLKKKKFYKKFNLIFIDPPFYYNYLYKIIPLCINLITKNGILYIQSEYSFDKKIKLSLISFWKIIKFGKIGIIFYYLLQKKVF